MSLHLPTSREGDESHGGWDVNVVKAPGGGVGKHSAEAREAARAGDHDMDGPYRAGYGGWQRRRHAQPGHMGQLVRKCSTRSSPR